jgi:hypothetical protein
MQMANAPDTAKVPLTESDLAMVDALSILFDVTVANRDAVARILDKALEVRARHWAKASRPKASAILMLLRKRSTEKGTLARKRMATALARVAPKGRA